MSRRYDLSLQSSAPAKNAAARSARRVVTIGKRARIGSSVLRGPYLPAETWYEPATEPRGEYEVIVRPAGKGFRHVVTEEDIRQRLAQLPAWMLTELQVVQLSTMTRKKRRSPCYGMQWGSSIYLYPIEETLIETFLQPPKPPQKIEAAMFGACWQPRGGLWQLYWTEETIRDFYLNNVLIHELGHIIDSRNSRYQDRERFAEWFAVEHGYKASRRAELAQRAVDKYIVRRHHRS
ncbi:MAG: hypothetical protein WD872_05695 [Pirellulaceae bacterium]